MQLRDNGLGKTPKAKQPRMAGSEFGRLRHSLPEEGRPAPSRRDVRKGFHGEGGGEAARGGGFLTWVQRRGRSSRPSAFPPHHQEQRVMQGAPPPSRVPQKVPDELQQDVLEEPGKGRGASAADHAADSASHAAWRRLCCGRAASAWRAPLGAQEEMRARRHPGQGEGERGRSRLRSVAKQVERSGAGPGLAHSD